MALYQRWLALKTGNHGFEVKKKQNADLEEIPEDDNDKENVGPNNGASIQAALDFKDRVKPVDIKSEGLIRFLVENSVKLHFR